MALSTATTVDVAQVLATALGGVDGLRTSWYVADNTRPPVALIPMPTIDFDDPEAPFCFATWTFGITIIVNRNQDRDAQQDLARFVSQAAQALNETQADGIFSIEPLSATPTTVTVAGTDLPAYVLRTRVRA